MRWQQQNIQQISNSQKTHHISPSRASYGVSVMSISHKIDRVIAAPHCTYNLLKIDSNVTVISYKRSRGRNVIIGIGNELVPSLPESILSQIIVVKLRHQVTRS